MFIWTIQDAINVIILIAIVLFLALLGGLILADKIQRKFKAWRSR